ncbi:MAG TPA: hypothetical protein VMF52_12215 [Steroidobacteraceae bacterium]|nr:hypothetical protein [Steroidobacteraceae bacterium]
MRNIFVHRAWGLAGCALVLAACGDPKSSSTSGPDGGAVPTSRMIADLKVVSSEPGVAVVRANLNDGKALGNSYRLDGGDFFRACISGVCRNMADNDSVTSPDYIARFDFQSGVDYVVSFNRQQDRNAPDSRISLPQAFTIVTPANHQQVSNGDSVVVSWSPAGPPARVGLSYESDCTLLSGGHSFGSGPLNDDTNGDGRETVRVDPIVSATTTNATSTVTRCSIDIKVSHQLQGKVDPAFDHGTAVGIVSRKINLDYLPR